jgi:hypothetical protein
MGTAGERRGFESFQEMTSFQKSKALYNWGGM